MAVPYKRAVAAPVTPVHSRLRRVFRSGIDRVPRPAMWSVVLACLGGAIYFGLPYLRDEYHYQMACKASDREAFDVAADHLRVCLSLFPGAGRSHFLLARTARRSAQYDLASKELGICRALKWPVHGLRLESSLQVFQRGGYDPETERQLQTALKSDNPDRFLVIESLSMGYMQTYRLPQALELLNLWIDEKPNSASARMRRGWLHERQDHLGDAEQDYREAVRIRPADLSGRLRLAEVLRLRGNLGEAMPLFAQLQEDFLENVPAKVGLTQCYVGLGRFDDAREILDDLLIREPGNFAILLERGKLSMRLGQANEARDWFQKAVAAAPEEYEPHYQLFLCLQRLGKSEEVKAEQSKIKAIEADQKLLSELTLDVLNLPNDANSRYRLAEIFMRRREFDQAIPLLNQVLQIDPRYEAAHRRLAEHYEKVGKPNLARTHREFLTALTGKP